MTELENSVRSVPKLMPRPNHPQPLIHPPSTQLLQILHTDLMGPIPTSYDGKNYIMTVLDDYSKPASVVTMNSKDETSAYPIHICNQLEN
jgi:hypothetical protein